MFNTLPLVRNDQSYSSHPLLLLEYDDGSQACIWVCVSTHSQRLINRVFNSRAIKLLHCTFLHFLFSDSTQFMTVLLEHDLHELCFESWSMHGVPTFGKHFLKMVKELDKSDKRKLYVLSIILKMCYRKYPNQVGCNSLDPSDAPDDSVGWLCLSRSEYSRGTGGGPSWSSAHASGQYAAGRGGGWPRERWWISRCGSSCNGIGKPYWQLHWTLRLPGQTLTDQTNLPYRTGEIRTGLNPTDHTPDTNS